jgi:hypothetical protein
MKRIAILGCENSHADAFLKCIKEKEKRIEKCYKCGNIRYVFGNNEYQYYCDKLKKDIGIHKKNINDSTNCPLFRKRTLLDKLKDF